MKYNVLGPVEALLDGEPIPLQLKCRHLLAVLVMERGRPVPRQRLMEIVWDDSFGREDRLTKVVSELRGHLRPGDPHVPDPVPAVGDAYRLAIRPGAADVDRFRSKAAEAKGLESDAAIRSMDAALAEWGEEDGLHGWPLAGLSGTWADSNRATLRSERRDAVLFRLELLARNGEDAYVAEQCRLLGDDATALLDEGFVATWMVAAHRAGGPDAPLAIFNRAKECSRRELQQPVSPALGELARRIQNRDPELESSQDRALTRWTGSPAASAHRPITGIGRIEETTTMSERDDHRPYIYNENSTIGVQGEEFTGPVTVHVGGAAPKAPEPEPEETGRAQDETGGRAS